ncbi:P-loop containing nucleoside triphosphate hydrolase protein [Baffinella frigidus]|nr:P-loop containing nucleoside triphosphate hydrolase protein [Cryptophyta sp. CCMP2293]
MAQATGTLSLIQPQADEARLAAWKKHKKKLEAGWEGDGGGWGSDIATLAANGLGMHHAGLLRSTKGAVEGAFRDGALRVLVSTSTLAWGVNLPARVVVVMGVQVFDSSVGRQRELGALELLQMFGRAGRPQYDHEGDAYLLCAKGTEDKLLAVVTARVPIESQMQV